MTNRPLNICLVHNKQFFQESGSEGQRLTEAKAINKSLSNLGNVIMALAQKVNQTKINKIF